MDEFLNQVVAIGLICIGMGIGFSLSIAIMTEIVAIMPSRKRKRKPKEEHSESEELNPKWKENVYWVSQHLPHYWHIWICLIIRYQMVYFPLSKLQRVYFLKIHI